MNEWQKAALIIGGSRGIGAGVAKVFAKNGFKIVVGYLRGKEEAVRLCEELQRKYGTLARAIQGDVSKEQECLRVFEEALSALGEITVLVNCAGQYTRDPSEEQKKEISNIKLQGVPCLTRLAAKNRVHTVIHLTSFLSSNHPNASWSSRYHAEVEEMIEKLALEYYHEPINIIGIRPGLCRGGTFLDHHSREEQEEYLQMVPDRKMIEPEEIGQFVYFISTMANCLNGQILNFDKGAHAFFESKLREEA